MGALRFPWATSDASIERGGALEPWQDEQHVEIAAPPDAIYRYLADLSNHPAWSETVVGIEPPAGEGFAVGSEFALLGERPGDRRVARVTALQAPMRVAWHVQSSRASEDWEFLILPSGSATTLALKLTVAPRRWVRWLAHDRWRTKEMAERNALILAMIKAILEARAEDGAPLSVAGP
jgi:hypothetical protein